MTEPVQSNNSKEWSAVEPLALPPIAYVSVCVATVWTDPHKPRPVDAAAVANPVDITAWAAAMTLEDKYGLSDQDISQTQALYGDPVHVLAEENGWCRIALPGQRTPKNALGYPGWMPCAHLSDDAGFAASVASRPMVRVNRSRTAWLFQDQLLSAKAMEISFLTCLPLLERTGGAICVDTPDAGARWISAEDVEILGDQEIGAAPTGIDLVNIAEKFLGLPYLWGGRSGFGPDCSGLTSLAYAAVGIDLPRDASAQALHSHGHKVDRADLQIGDLLFWANAKGTGSIHHVAMYIDAEHMIEAPGSANPVRITEHRFDDEYWGALRFLDVR